VRSPPQVSPARLCPAGSYARGTGDPRAKVAISTHFSNKHQAFLDFVLAHYVAVDELDPEKLTPLLGLKYVNSIADAIADLGRPEEINRVFVGFQNYLY
jgi:type I restriction enzyme, R subunit